MFILQRSVQTLIAILILTIGLVNCGQNEWEKSGKNGAVPQQKNNTNDSGKNQWDTSNKKDLLPQHKGNTNNSEKTQRETSHKKDVLPEHKGYINDYADVISTDDREKIQMMLSELDKEMGIQTVFVTINSINDYGTKYKMIEAFATDLLNQWKIGSEKNNGILILLSLKEQQCRIILGVEYKDAYKSVVEQIVENKMTPYFAKNNYTEGILDGVSELIMELTKVDYEKIKFDKKGDDIKHDVALEDVNADQYRYGAGVDGNQLKAFELYRKAANQGDVNAMVELSEYYEQGIWVRRDHEKSMQLLKQAADAGSLSAKWQLEFMEMKE